VREQVELLEHHADLAPHLLDVRMSVVEFDAIDGSPLLMALQPVDAADQRRLAGAGRAADDDALAALTVRTTAPVRVRARPRAEECQAIGS
jgi:hypothetical protein